MQGLNQHPKALCKLPALWDMGKAVGARLTCQSTVECVCVGGVVSV